MNVTREVVTDLWPAYAAGEASADTRTLVDEFLRQDPEFARLVQNERDEQLRAQVVPALPADRETRAFCQTKKQLHGWDWLHFLAILFSAFAFGRIISDTSFDVSPRNFIITALIAAGFWIAYFVRMAWVRRNVYRSTVRPEA
jgi:hypothetical protein